MRVRGGWVLLAAALLSGVPAWGQVSTPDPLKVFHAPAPLPSYDVATIKPGSANNGGIQGPGGRMIVMGGPGQGQTVLLYLQSAYGIPRPSQMRVIGGPAWMRSDPYMIQGKPSEELRDAMQKMTPAERLDMNRSLQQSLLLDRFKLKVHFETREMQVYELAPAKGGLKIKQVAAPPPFVPGAPGLAMGPAAGRPPGPPPAFPGPGQPIPPGMVMMRMRDNGMREMNAGATTMAGLSNLLMNESDVAGRPVVDKTGFTGNFDIAGLAWAGSRPPGAGGDPGGNGASASDAQGASLFTALEETLGIKLVPAKAQVEVIVIDSIERPTEN